MSVNTQEGSHGALPFRHGDCLHHAEPSGRIGVLLDLLHVLGQFRSSSCVELQNYTIMLVKPTITYWNPTTTPK